MTYITVMAWLSCSHKDAVSILVVELVDIKRTTEPIYQHIIRIAVGRQLMMPEYLQKVAE